MKNHTIVQEMRDCRDQNVLTFGQTDFRDTLEREGSRNEDNSEVDGASPHWNDGAVLRSIGHGNAKCRGADLKLGEIDYKGAI